MTQLSRRWIPVLSREVKEETSKARAGQRGLSMSRLEYVTPRLKSEEPFTATVFLAAFITSGYQSPNPKHGDRRSRLHFTEFGVWTFRYIWSNWVFLDTEQKKNRNFSWATRSLEFLFRESQRWQRPRHPRYEEMRPGSCLGNDSILNKWRYF